MLGEYTKKEIDSIFEKLNRDHRYLLLTGGTGVGKTLYAKILANTITKKKFPDRYNQNISENQQVELFSFGANYSRESFIYGINVHSKDDKLLFKEESKRFLEVCKTADNNKGYDYVVIFDDINRADISGVLGDLLSAMESGDIGNEIHAGDKSIAIPDNLYIIATANPLVGKEKLDYAWMRRFMHHNISPDERHFGFDFDGSDIGDGYRQYVDEAWQKVYFYDEENGVWSKKKNQKIEYDDTAGKINDVGLAFLKQYQWEIFMHIKIMYERYFYDLYDQSKRDQHIPGHGMFLTYDSECSYGENLILFFKKLKHSILPLIEKMYSDNILNEGARLDIWTFYNLCGEKKQLHIDNAEISNRIIESKDPDNNYKDKELVSYVNEIVENIKENTDKWSNLYFNICTNAWLQRIDRKQTPKPSKTAITVNTKCSYLLERTEYIDNVYSGYSESNKLPCHHKDIALKIEEVNLHWPQQVTKGREYLTKQKTPEKYLFSDILKLIKKYQCIEKERVNNMGNKTDLSEIKIMDTMNIKQMILQGPPGTSKTYGAKYKIIVPELQKLPDYNESDLLKSLKEGETREKKLLENYQINNYKKWDKNCGWDMVQFHPSYGYEDFVRGITVKTNDKQDVVYETVNKILGKLCELAQKHEEDEKSKFFLIIDEINRADIATVFGELIYALECRGEEVCIPYEANGSSKLRIPNNLYIIGTMNTADKSIGTIDYAIRRRFLFFDRLPEKEVIEDYFNENIKNDDLKEKAKKMMDNLMDFTDDTINRNYHAKDLYIGHTYFLVKDDTELKLKLQYQIIPILREYYENGILTEWGKCQDGWKKDLRDCLTRENSNSQNNVIEELFEKIIN